MSQPVTASRGLPFYLADVMADRAPQSVTDDLRKLIETLGAGNQGQAQVLAQALLSDLKELTTQRRHPTTRQNFYPAEQAGFDVEKTLSLRKALAQSVAEIQGGDLDLALQDCQKALTLWAPSKAD
jgi:hypothetical protein